MKSVIALVASLFVVTSAFAQAPAKKEEAKPTAPAAAPASAPAKKEEAKKSEAAKPAAKAEDKKAEAAKK